MYLTVYKVYLMCTVLIHAFVVSFSYAGNLYRSLLENDHLWAHLEWPLPEKLRYLNSFPHVSSSSMGRQSQTCFHVPGRRRTIAIKQCSSLYFVFLKIIWPKNSWLNLVSRVKQTPSTGMGGDIRSHSKGHECQDEWVLNTVSSVQVSVNDEVNNGKECI